MKLRQGEILAPVGSEMEEGFLILRRFNLLFLLSCKLIQRLLREEDNCAGVLADGRGGCRAWRCPSWWERLENLWLPSHLAEHHLDILPHPARTPWTGAPKSPRPWLMGWPRLSMEGYGSRGGHHPHRPSGTGRGRSKIQDLTMHIQQARSWGDATLLVSAQAPCVWYQNSRECPDSGESAISNLRNSCLSKRFLAAAIEVF